MNINYLIRKELNLSNEDFDVDINIGSGSGSSGDLSDTPLSPVMSSGKLTPEAAEVEVEEEASAADETSEEIDEMEKDVETLESYYMALSASLESGGITPVAAGIMNIGVDHIVRKYSVRADEFMPSMEDFSDNGYTTTTVSMEKIGKAMDSVKKGVKEAMMKFWNFIKGVFESIRRKLFPSIRDRLNALDKVATKASPDKKDVKVKGGKLKFLNGNYSLTDYVDFTNKLTNLVDGGLKELVNTVNRFKSADIDKSGELVKELVNGIIVIIESDVFKKSFDSKSNEGGSTLTLPFTYGLGKLVYSQSVAEKEQGELQKLYKETPVFRIELDKSEADTKDVSVKTMSANEIKDFVKVSLNLLNAIDKQLSTINGSFTDTFRNLDKMGEAEGLKDKYAVIRARRALTKAVTTFAKDLSSFSQKLIGGMMIIAAASVGKKDEGADDTKKDDKK